jgi:hypothetical protein
MTDFLEKLAFSAAPSASTDHLQMLGLRASKIYMNKEAKSLTVAVGNVVKGEDLSKDQVQRIAEAANQATWRHLFSEGGDSDASFEPASASEVSDSLVATPSTYEAPNLDYLKDPPGEMAPADDDLKAIFDTEEPEAYPDLNPHRDAEVAKEKVASARDLARHGQDLLFNDMHTLGESFYNLVKQAHLQDGMGILQISRAVGQSVESTSFAHSLMKVASDRLAKEGIRFNESLELSKFAQRVVVNPEHPLIKTAGHLEEVAKAHFQAESAHKRLIERDANALGFLQDKLREA